MGLFSRKPKNPLLEKAEQERKAIREKYGVGKSYGCGVIWYHGGLMGIPDSLKNNLVCADAFESGILFDVTPDFDSEYRYYYQFIPMSDIINYQIKNEVEIQKDVTLPRVLLLGILSLAAQKATKTGTRFLLINYQNAGITKQALFSASITDANLTSFESGIRKAKKQYLDSPRAVKDAQEAEAKQKERPAVAAADTSSTDIPGQIEKLADLLKKGILTQEEFASKKAELLARI